MTKLEVEEQRLGQCVVMPANLDCSFLRLDGDLLTQQMKLKSEHHTVDMATQVEYLTRQRQPSTSSF